MPGRKFTGGNGYRYGFNGKENAEEISSGDYDYGARIYDGRLGRWLSVDPLQSKYPNLSPYNYVANSPINAVDPDGRLIIFINGLWGWPNKVGKGADISYWGKQWVKDAQDAIGDHKSPLFYDGSMGGTKRMGGSVFEKDRIAAGEVAGYSDGKTIIGNLDKDETIKIITNSMGAAFERGFSEGLLKYRDERLGAIGGELLLAGFEKSNLEKQISPDRIKALNQGMMIQPETELEKQYRNITNKISALNSEKGKLQKVEIEMVIDLSAHQTDNADPNASANYYMAADENVSKTEYVLGVNETKHVRRSKYLGKMDRHHSSGADPKKFPKSAKPN